MGFRCPGQDGRNLTASIHICPNCGAEVEMFSDEVRVRCRGCGAWVEKEAVPSCIEWCVQARACIGEARWQALMEARGNVEEAAQAESGQTTGRGPE
jgi:ribosomal protein S27AE